MQPRPLGGVERVMRISDRLYTLNFVTVARVRGAFTREQLVAALDALARRHPLLRAKVERRGFRLWLVPGSAAGPTLIEQESPFRHWPEHAEALLKHREWPEAGPRAELVCLRHGEAEATFLLSLHHVISDGSSGVIAMRDLLRILGGEALSGAAIDVPPQESIYPAERKASARLREALTFAARELKQPTPLLLSRAEDAALEARRNRVRVLQLEGPALLGLARRQRTTVHGLLSGALLLAVQRETRARVCLMHALDMRRYVRSLGGAAEPRELFDRVGCYVSYLQTRHGLRDERTLGEWAREVTASIRDKKAAGEPFLTSPFMGKALVFLAGFIPLHVLRRWAERMLSANTLGLTNLGALESLGMAERFGQLRVSDCFFVASPSCTGSLCVAASSFGQRTTLAAVHVDPLLDEALCTRLMNQTTQTLTDALGTEDAR